MSNPTNKRHGWRKLFMMILTLVLLGVILLGIGAVGMLLRLGDLNIDWPDFEFGSKGEYTYNSYRYTADPDVMEHVKLNFDNRRIEVVPYDGDEILLEFFASQYDRFEVKEEKTTFVAKLEKKNVLMFNFDLSFLFCNRNDAQRAVLLHLPATYIGDLEIETSNGDITLTMLENLGDIKLDTNNGSIVIDHLTLDKLELKTSNGRIELGDIFADSIEAKTSNASIEAQAVRAHELLLLVTSNGKITANEIDSNNIDLKTSNGRIAAVLSKPKNDFTIFCDTSNGDCNIENGGTGYKKLNVKTNNGDIDIRFAESF